MRTKTPLSNSSRRGAARVSAVWVIVSVVLLLVSLGFAYISQDDASAADRVAKSASAARTAAQDQLQEKVVELSARSRILGFTEDAATTPSNLEIAQAALKDAEIALPDDMAGVTTFQDALPAAVKAYQGKVAQIGEMQKRIDELTAQVSSERSAKSELESAKDELIAGLEQQLTDREDALQAEITRLESASSDMRSKLEGRATEVTGLEESVRQSARKLDETKQQAASTYANHTRIQNDIRRRSEKPDGEISATMGEFNIGIINLTAADRLSEGTVFSIVSGRPGADINKPKAFCRVTNVGVSNSQVEIYGVVDELGQPVVQGDKIYNKLYEPKGQRNAVFAGNITGAYNKPELLALFAEIGITVQDSLTNTTDFLIVGGPLFVDEEGEPYEEPRQPETLPIYAEAVDRGVTVIPVRDVLQFFRR